VPDAQVKGPPITVTCDCGQRHRLAYGDEVRCTCGRRYTTARIPLDEYREVASTVRRFRLLTFAAAAVFALLALLVALTQPAMLVLLVPGGLLVWFTYLRPLVRGQYRKAIARFPTWQLRAERPDRRASEV